MAKVTLSNLVNLQNESTAIGVINANSALIQTAMDNTLSRDGTSPNTMNASLDMNSQKILNLPAPVSALEPVRKQEFDAAIGGIPNISANVTAAQTAATNAANSAAAAAASALAAAQGVVPDNGVSTIKIQDGAVTTVKIADSNVTLAKMATGSVDSSKIVDGSIATIDLGANVVTPAKLGLGAWTTVASAATVDLNAQTSRNIVVSGTVTITSFGTTAASDNVPFLVRFAAALTLTNGANLILPTGANITTAAGDVLTAVWEGANVWRVVDYQRASGAALVGASTVAVAGVFKNLKITNGGTPNTQVALTADSVVATDGSAFVASGAISLTISTGSVGANALDAGTVANSTWYSVWAIYNGTTWAGLLSTSATAPTMPGIYTYKVRLGWVRTDSSANLFRTLQYGRTARYTITAATNTSAYPSMATGLVGSVLVPTWISVATGNFIPSTACELHGILGTLSAGTTICAPNNAHGAYNSTTAPPPVFSSDSTIQEINSFEMILESTNIYWASNNASGFIMCRGWQDNI